MDSLKIIDEVMLRVKRSQKPVICNVSNRHLHLRQEDIEKLFGTNYRLKKLKNLMQPGEYSCHEKVDVLGPKSTIKGVRVLGPARTYSQLELTRTDCYTLGIKGEVRESGDIKGTSGIRIIGPYGSIELLEGAIISWRHIHMTSADARGFKVKDKQIVRIRTSQPRSVVFEDVLIRVNDKYCLECHIDTDEANACDLKSGDEVFLS